MLAGDWEATENDIHCVAQTTGPQTDHCTAETTECRETSKNVSMIVHSGFWASVLMTDQLNVFLG